MRYLMLSRRHKNLIVLGSLGQSLGEIIERVLEYLGLETVELYANGW
jgi:hypothetical protein